MLASSRPQLRFQGLLLKAAATDGFDYLLTLQMLRRRREVRGGLRLDTVYPGNVTVQVASRVSGGLLCRGQLRRRGKRRSLRAKDGFREKS